MAKEISSKSIRRIHFYLFSYVIGFCFLRGEWCWTFCHPFALCVSLSKAAPFVGISFGRGIWKALATSSWTAAPRLRRCGRRSLKWVSWFTLKSEPGSSEIPNLENPSFFQVNQNHVKNLSGSVTVSPSWRMMQETSWEFLFFFVPKSFLERRKIEDAKVRDRWQVKLLGPNISPSYIRIQPPAESRETNG